VDVEHLRLFGIDVLRLPKGLQAVRDRKRPAAARTVLWQNETCDDLPQSDTHGIATFWQEQDEMVWLTHLVSLGGKTLGQFHISRDGCNVRSQVSPDVAEGDVTEFFTKYVLNTILLLWELPVLHAAVLEKSNSQVMLLGDSGNGKSTLSLALQKLGWELVTDDVAVLQKHSSGWRVLQGPAEALAHDDTATALMEFSEGGERKFQGDTHDFPNKIKIRPNRRENGAASDAPLAAMLFLSPRIAKEDWREPGSCKLEPLDFSKAVHLLFAHRRRGLLSPEPPPSVVFAKAVEGLANQAKAFDLRIVDDLARVEDAARIIERAMLADQAAAGYGKA
jgi:hypothetical protein